MEARVFCRKTNMSPIDNTAYYGPPDLFTPVFETVFISCSFTWDIDRAYLLKKQWERHGKKILIGGPAFGDRGDNFTPGMFLKKGVVITSRGCPNTCSFCFVPGREGKTRELEIMEGNIVQDNNLLACSKNHIEKVFSMLKKQKHIDFSGGLDITRFNNWHIELLRSISLYQLWIAFDMEQKKNIFIKVVEKLKYVFKRDKIRAYVLIGFENDTIEKAETRLRFAYEVGTLPFAMRYRNEKEERGNTFLYNGPEWGVLTRNWTRPAIIKSVMRKK